MNPGVVLDFWQMLALTGTAATILGVFLIIYGIINNKTLKNESRLTREIIQKESELTRQMIQEMTAQLQQQARQEQELTRQMIQETAKYLGDLVVKSKS